MMYVNKRKEKQAEERTSCRKEIELHFFTFKNVKNENDLVLYILLIYIDLLPSNRIKLNYIFLCDKTIMFKYLGNTIYIFYIKMTFVY